jgi:flavin-dependent dehydrogenase
MTGDAAGMITPLCGNGMAMAIHSSKIVSDLIIKHFSKDGFDRSLMEKEYRYAWNATFAARLRMGRLIQHKLFGSVWSSTLAVNLALYSKFIATQIIKKTHGEPF